MSNNDSPTEINADDLNKVMQKMLNGDFDIKMRACCSCNKDHFPSYGAHIGECDECYFNRFPKDQVEKFYRSFF